MPASDRDRICVIGEALPDDDGATCSLAGSPWVAWLRDLLDTRSGGWRVDDCTRPGWTAHKLMEHHTDDVLLDPPHTLIIHCGLADAQGCLRSDRWSKDAGATAAAVGELVSRTRARRAQTRILVMSPVCNSLCTSPYRLGPLRAALAPYARWLEELATRSRCLWLDSARLVTQAKERSDDDLCYGAEHARLDMRGAIGLAEAVAHALGELPTRARWKPARGDTLVAIGDSLCDANRRPRAGRPLGAGYVAVAEALQAVREPERQARWINRGIGGDTVVDIESRWERDVLAHRPRWVSLNTGLNDCNRIYSDGVGIPPERHGAMIGALIARTRAADPAIRMVMFGSYCLTKDEHQGSYNTDLKQRLPAYRDAARAACAAHHVPFIDGQALMDGLLARMPYRRFAADGVHPDPVASLAIAEAWLGALASAGAARAR